MSSNANINSFFKKKVDNENDSEVNRKEFLVVTKQEIVKQ